MSFTKITHKSPKAASYDEACAFMGVSRTGLQYMLRKGRVRGFIVGKRGYIPWDDIHEVMQDPYRQAARERFLANMVKKASEPESEPVEVVVVDAPPDPEPEPMVGLADLREHLARTLRFASNVAYYVMVAHATAPLLWRSWCEESRKDVEYWAQAYDKLCDEEDGRRLRDAATAQFEIQ